MAALVRRRKARVAVSRRQLVRRTFRESTELPAEYGRTRLVLMEVDPTRIHAYWEVTQEDRAAAAQRLGRGESPRAWVLRFHEIPPPGTTGPNPDRIFDVAVDLISGNWYVAVPESGRSYCAELGPVACDGRFAAACRSNTVHVPRREASPRYRPDWLEVGPAGETIRRMPESVPAPASRARNAPDVQLDFGAGFEFPKVETQGSEAAAAGVSAAITPAAAQQEEWKQPCDVEVAGETGGFPETQAPCAGMSSFGLGVREFGNCDETRPAGEKLRRSK